MKENAEKNKQDKEIDMEIRKQELEEKVLKKALRIKKERDKNESYIRGN